MTINERFFSLLKESKLKQKEFCEKAGISEKTVSAWKSRKSDLPASAISTIADVLGVSPLFLLVGDKALTVAQLSDEEKELLSNYAALDNRGKHKLHTIIYEELDRKSGDEEAPRPIPFAASGEADITPENYEKIQAMLQNFEKRAKELNGG